MINALNNLSNITTTKSNSKKFIVYGITLMELSALFVLLKPSFTCIYGKKKINIVFHQNAIP